jgi:hypothetical protein
LERFNDPDFFLGESDAVIDTLDELLAKGIIHALVNRDLTYDLLVLASAADVYLHLVTNFRVVSQASQLHAWNNLLNVDPSQRTTTTALYEKFANLVKSFTKQGMTLCWDKIIGLVMQNNLKDSLCQSVDQKVTLFMESHKGQMPSSQDILQFINAARTEAKLAESAQQKETLLLQVNLASRPGSSVSGQSNVQEVDAWALSKTARCYICNKIDHLAPECPNKKWGHAAKPNNQLTGNAHTNPSFPPCSITYNFDRAPYVNPLQPGPIHQQTPRTAPPNHQKPTGTKDTTKPVETRMMNPDLFANDDDKTYTFEQEDLSVEPTFERFNIRQFSIDNDKQEVLWDSGLLDNVTGNRYALHDFNTLTRPIAVKVATDGPCNYITGMGTLKF